jgi:Down syndrome cell adhesion protein
MVTGYLPSRSFILGDIVPDLCYREVEGKHGYNFSEIPWQHDGKGQFRLDGLKKYCKYGLVIQAFNGRGSGPMSPEVVAQTLEDGELSFPHILDNQKKG